mgnify:FL=1
MLNTKLLRLAVLQAGAMEIRDVDDGAEPFLYASGNWGPGYISVKGLVSHKPLFIQLNQVTAEKVAAAAPHVNFVAGNVTGGVIPGWEIAKALDRHLGREVPYLYIRESRKKGGQKERITGLVNHLILTGHNGLVVEELVNFSETSCHSALLLRELGYAVTHAACILFYNNPRALVALKEAHMEMVYLFTLGELLDTAEEAGTHPRELTQKYRDFLKDPLGWQAARGLKRVEKGGTI